MIKASFKNNCQKNEEHKDQPPFMAYDEEKTRPDQTDDLEKNNK